MTEKQGLGESNRKRKGNRKLKEDRDRNRDERLAGTRINRQGCGRRTGIETRSGTEEQEQ